MAEITIDKAIEILTLMGSPEFRGHTEDILAARQLGIEALKRIQLHREHSIPGPMFHLPGERIV